MHMLKQPVLRPMAAAIVGAGLLVAGGQAMATTAADATIRNTVTVSYADAGGNAQTPLLSSVDVTVNLVRANPILNAPADQSTDAATDAVYSYTITTAANGVATYNLTTPLAQSAGISGSTATALPASVTLGATTVASAVSIAAAGTTVITVPRDNTVDGSINGLVVGDIVVIGGQEFLIAAIGADNVGPGTTTITVNGNGSVLNAAVGALVAERKTFSLTVDPGTVSDATVDQTITVTTTATDAIDGAYTSNDVTVTTVLSVGLTVQKLVRNSTSGAAGTGTSVSYGGNTYYPGGITGNPGDVLEYLIVVTKSATTASATQVRISDPVPPFTTYVANSLRLDNGSGLSVLNDSGADGDAGETDNNTIYIYPGAGGSDGGAGAPGIGDGVGGSLGASDVSYALFQVSIQ